MELIFFLYPDPIYHCFDLIGNPDSLAFVSPLGGVPQDWCLPWFGPHFPTAMVWMPVSLPNSYAENLMSKVMVSGDGAFRRWYTCLYLAEWWGLKGSSGRGSRQAALEKNISGKTGKATKPLREPTPSTKVFLPSSSRDSLKLGKYIH